MNYSSFDSHGLSPRNTFMTTSGGGAFSNPLRIQSNDFLGGSYTHSLGSHLMNSAPSADDPLNPFRLSSMESNASGSGAISRINSGSRRTGLPGSGILESGSGIHRRRVHSSNSLGGSVRSARSPTASARGLSPRVISPRTGTGLAAFSESSKADVAMGTGEAYDVNRMTSDIARLQTAGSGGNSTGTSHHAGMSGTGRSSGSRRFKRTLRSASSSTAASGGSGSNSGGPRKSTRNRRSGGKASRAPVNTSSTDLLASGGGGREPFLFQVATPHLGLSEPAEGNKAGSVAVPTAPSPVAFAFNGEPPARQQHNLVPAVPARFYNASHCEFLGNEVLSLNNDEYINVIRDLIRQLRTRAPDVGGLGHDPEARAREAKAIIGSAVGVGNSQQPPVVSNIALAQFLTPPDVATANLGPSPPRSPHLSRGDPDASAVTRAQPAAAAAAPPVASAGAPPPDAGVTVPGGAVKSYLQPSMPLPKVITTLSQMSLNDIDGTSRPTKKNRRSSFLHLLASDARIRFVTWAPDFGRTLRSCDLVLSNAGRESLINLMKVVYGSESTLAHHFWHLKEPRTGREYWRCKNPDSFRKAVDYRKARLNKAGAAQRDQSLVPLLWTELAEFERANGSVITN